MCECRGVCRRKFRETCIFEVWVSFIVFSTLIYVSGSTDKHTKLEIDLIGITKYIYLTLTLYFNSHILLHSSHASIQLSTGHLPDHICFFVTMLALSCSRIHLSHSFFLLPLEYLKHSDHTTPLILSLSPHSSFHTNIMYFHSSMATTTTISSSDFLDVSSTFEDPLCLFHVSPLICILLYCWLSLRVSRTWRFSLFFFATFCFPRRLIGVSAQG